MQFGIGRASAAGVMNTATAMSAANAVKNLRILTSVPRDRGAAVAVRGQSREPREKYIDVNRRGRGRAAQ